MPLARRLSARLSGAIRLHVTYVEGSGVMLTSSGGGILSAPTVLAGIDGVTAIRQMDEDPD